MKSALSTYLLLNYGYTIDSLPITCLTTPYGTFPVFSLKSNYNHNTKLTKIVP